VIAVEVKAWAAWSPGIETDADWQGWFADPRPLARDGNPDVSFLPALTRRRCDQLSRMMLNVAYRSTKGRDASSMNSVFASQRGSLSVMIAMLESLVREKPLSPNKFSHSVHNTQAGLFSIWAKNNRANTALAAGRQTFANGFLEAVSNLQAGGDDGAPVLYVTGDEAIPATIEQHPASVDGSFAVALVIERVREGGMELRIDAGDDAAEYETPDALRFLRWLLSDEPELRLPHPRRTWVWQRR
jgi:hypothetical protein